MKYSNKSKKSSVVEEMPTVTASELKNSTADVLDRALSGGPMAITRHNKPRAVLLSIDKYEELVPEELPGLVALREEYQQVYEEMQSPENKAAAMRAFNATPEELGGAAVRGAQRLTK